MDKKERVQIFIEGGNLHHLVLKKLNIKELDFSFEDFIDFLVGDREITEFGKRFYIGTVREKRDDEYSKQAMSKQTALLNTLEAKNWSGAAGSSYRDTSWYLLVYNLILY